MNVVPTTLAKEIAMSRFRKLSNTPWHCQFHIVRVPKYRHCILTGNVGHEVSNYIRAFCQQKEIEIVEMNIQPDHVHLLVMIPPKVSVSDCCGIRRILSSFCRWFLLCLIIEFFTYWVCLSLL